MLANVIRKYIKNQVIKLEKIRKNIGNFSISITLVVEALEYIKKAESCLLEATESNDSLWDLLLESIEKQKALYRQRIEEKIEILEENLEDPEIVSMAIKEIREILKEN